MNLTRENIYDRLDQLPYTTPEEILVQFENTGDSVLATRGFWSLCAGAAWMEMRDDVLKSKQRIKIICEQLPVSSQATINRAAREIQTGEVIDDLSRVGKGKKNRFQENMVLIQTLRDQCDRQNSRREVLSQKKL